MGIALEIARRANALSPEQFSAEALDWAKTAIIDLIGCALAGAPETTTERVMKASVPPGIGGTCTVIGKTHRMRPLDAALVNGTAGHALDFDDTSRSLAGHPTVVIVPALLALAEKQGASGRALLDAYIVGLEVATRIARGVNFHHYEKGWHPTATLGIFGAAAACGRLLGLDTAQTATALAICASEAAGVKSNFGSQTKPLHAGLAARSGLFAALLAQAGFEAGPEAFEHPQGFFNVFNCAGNYDPDRILAPWAEPLDILAPGISIKKYPCVYSVHGAIDAAIRLKAEHGFKAEDIDDVVVTMHRRRLLPHVQRQAMDALDAKFSLPYAVARALADGNVLLDHFEGDAWRDPRIRQLMGKIVTRPHSDDGNDYGASVEVRLTSGARVRAAVDAPLGRGPETPLPQEMLRTKFLDCASRALARPRAQRAFDLLGNLEHMEDIRVLTATLADTDVVPPSHPLH